MVDIKYTELQSVIREWKPFGSPRRRWKFTFKRIFKRYDVRLWTVFLWLTSIPAAVCHEHHSLSGSTRGRYLTRQQTTSCSRNALLCRRVSTGAPHGPNSYYALAPLTVLIIYTLHMKNMQANVITTLSQQILQPAIKDFNAVDTPNFLSDKVCKEQHVWNLQMI